MLLARKLLAGGKQASFLGAHAGAVIALSLRDLTGADPFVVKVRRSSDNTTSDFRASEVLDGTLAAWVGAGSGYVDTWYDQSGNGNHVVSTANSYQPRIVNSGTVDTDNGKPALYFDNVDDFLRLSSLTLPSGTVNATYWVSHVSGTTANRFVQSNAANVLYQQINGGYYYFKASSTQYGTYVGTAAQHVFAMLYDGAGAGNTDRLKAYEDGALKTLSFTGTIPASVTTSISNFDIGGSGSAYTFAGYIQEYVMFGADKSSENGSILADVNNHYGVY